MKNLIILASTIFFLSSALAQHPAAGLKIYCTINNSNSTLMAETVLGSNSSDPILFEAYPGIIVRIAQFGSSSGIPGANMSVISEFNSSETMLNSFQNYALLTVKKASGECITLFCVRK